MDHWLGLTRKPAHTWLQLVNTIDKLLTYSIPLLVSLYHTQQSTTAIMDRQENECGNTHGSAVNLKEDAKLISNKSNTRLVNLSNWCKFYFLEGQTLQNATDGEAASQLHDREGLDSSWSQTFLKTHTRLVAFTLPAVIVHFFWWAFMIKRNLWYLFQEKYFMSITMVFGSLIAGMTSEGGGAVAFPVMTLAFHIPPSTARDFSVIIQSFGMSAAAFTILFMKIKLEWNALIFCSIGGIFGVIFGLEIVDHWFSSAQKKFMFVSIWFSFAFALFLLNRNRNRRTFLEIKFISLWKVFVLLLTGFVGGIFTSFAGSGLDICSFSILTLLFRVTEKTATPTSVVLMAGNTLVAFFWRQAIQNGIELDTWEYVAVCVPVVVIGAPLGSLMGSHMHRLVLATFVYILDTIALISAFIVVRPLTPVLIGLSIGIMAVGLVIFILLSWAGKFVLQNTEIKEMNCIEHLDE